MFWRFGLTGVLNTAIDFSLLNLLILSFGAGSGWKLFALNSVSFMAASLNSYFINKRWTFQDRERGESLQKFGRFLLTNSSSLLINSGTVYVISSFVLQSLPFLAGPNLAKIAATVLSLFWNFFLMKYWVFRKAKPQPGTSPPV